LPTSDHPISKTGLPVWSSIANWFAKRMDVRNSRIALSELSDFQLMDIGLTREQAGFEANLPWWR
jgi:uncharacterized protein YjiS (DUF1127 family)